MKLGIGLVVLVLVAGAVGYVFWETAFNQRTVRIPGIRLDPQLRILNNQLLGYGTYLGWGIPQGAYCVTYEDTHGFHWFVWLVNANKQYLLDVSQWNVQAGDDVVVDGYWAGTIGPIPPSTEIPDYPGNLFHATNIAKTTDGVL